MGDQLYHVGREEIVSVDGTNMHLLGKCQSHNVMFPTPVQLPR